ncbi:TauD/TfdA family dioxygenase [Merismopedia glauca]|uniref:Taurine catabolism dioxygenase TauD n=1 Tax=Merismopedia glauca CCAP 1448/3 TaxID=1296344 RepID=A0A2T1BX73_9CYAN|nr:TauD/TfdA family dioxygenase [Merismopedia glauca]PSB00558.1 taurine catabolism dioxygenase TauD [Merismopedia glauca CCAP 1448/3]
MNLPKICLTPRRSLKISTQELVNIGSRNLPDSIPLLIEPNIENVDLLEWSETHLNEIENALLKHRALLFRGFNIKCAEQFDRFIKITAKGDLLEYRDRSSPRHEISGKIYTSTDYPATHSIFPHNEGTYWQTFPLKIYFCCLQTAETGGETPIVDTRKVLAKIHPKIREKFQEKGVLYVRNYNDGFGLNWQTVFQTDRPEIVEEYCYKNQIRWEWKDNNRLRTYQVRPAIAKHPATHESIWFNHAAFFHITTLEPDIRSALLAEFSEEELPHNTYYGDGSPIEDFVLDEIREVYQQETVIFPWKNGDILLLDNMSVAHSRKPFSGARKVLVGMAEPFSIASKNF